MALVFWQLKVSYDLVELDMLSLTIVQEISLVKTTLRWSHHFPCIH